MVSKKKLFALFITAFMVSQINAAPDPNFHIYLLFGQSNMTGGGATSPIIASDCDTSPRVKVMAYMDCSNNSPECNWPNHRIHDQWYTASPPLHDCSEGLCPGDYFAKTMLDSIRSDIKIGLIPCALAGQSLNVFLPNGANATLGPPTGKNGYAWMLARCKLAQQVGVIKGFLLHQGESGTGNSTPWLTMAKTIFDDLKKDLNLGPDIPIVAGELRSDNTSPAPNNAGFNKMVDSLPLVYPHTAVASSKGLVGNGRDIWHFTTAGFREFGKRYAIALLSVANPDSIPRKTVNISNLRLVKCQDLKSQTAGVNVYSLNGKMVRSFSTNEALNASRTMKTGGVYIVNYRFKNGGSAILPFVKE